MVHAPADRRPFVRADAQRTAVGCSAARQDVSMIKPPLTADRPQYGHLARLAMPAMHLIDDQRPT